MRIVLSNSYGTPNVGDEAILTVLDVELRKAGHDVSILTFDPPRTGERHPQATAIRSGVVRGAWRTFKAIRQADLLIVGGGGIIQDATSLGNLLFHLSRAWMAKLGGTPYSICGAGIGPLRRALSRRLVAAACAGAATIVVRDEQSATLLADIGVPAERSITGADLAWLFEADGFESPADRGNASGPLIGLSMRPPVGNARQRAGRTEAHERYVREGALLADKLVESHDARIVFISMNPEQDDDVAEDLASFMRHGNRLTTIGGTTAPETIRAAIGGLDLLVGTRLHSIIFAASQSVPVIGLAYDAKVRACMQALGLADSVIEPQEWSASLVAERVAETLSNPGHQRAALEAAVPSLRARAARTVSECTTGGVERL